MTDNDARAESENQPSRLSVLNGIWFRRERERIAIGRPVVAAHLGVPARRVAALETKNMAVPNQWWPLLPALGFQHPWLLLSSQEANPADSPAEPSPPAARPMTLITEQPDAIQTHLRAPTLPKAAQTLSAQAAAAQGAQDAAPAGSMQQPDTTSATPPPTPPVTATQVAVQPQARLPPAPRIPRGLWLRSRRLELGHSLQAMSKALALSAHDLGVLEWQNLLIPPAWMSILASFRFCRWAPSPAGQGPVEGQPTGAWLRLERQRKGFAIETCAISLGIRPAFLELVELQDWPLTPEWLPVLAQLGFAGPGSTPSPVVPNAAAAAVEVAPPSPPERENEQTSAEQNGALGERTQQPVPAPLTEAASRRVHRQEGRLSPVLSAENLKAVNRTIGSHQHADKPGSPDHLPLLRTLDAPVPPQSINAAWVDAPSPSGPRAAAAAKAALPPRTENTQPRTKQNNVSGARKKQPGRPAPLTGAWLRVQRLKRKLSMPQLAKKLKVSALTLGRYERAGKPVRPDWLPLLRKLGFPVPQPSTDDAVSPSPPPSPVASAQDLRPSGSWLRTERKRLGLDALELKKALGGIKIQSIRNLERRSDKWVPDSWLSTLSVLGFCLPPHLASWNSSKIAGTQQHRGNWLLKARQRLKVSEAQVRRAVGVHSATLTAIERHNRILPAAWLPALAQLGLIVPGENAAPPPPRNKPEKTQNPEPTPTGQPPASSAVAVEPGSIPAALSPEQRKDLITTIMKYRLHLGRSAGKPAFQVLGWITQDMQQAGLEDFVTYELLHAALQALKWRTRY